MVNVRHMQIDPKSAADLSAQIASAIRDEIIEGRLIVDARLPSEAELADHFDVSRPTVREALKRLAAQSLIRTQRGASGGAFVVVDERCKLRDSLRGAVRAGAVLRADERRAVQCRQSGRHAGGNSSPKPTRPHG